MTQAGLAKVKSSVWLLAVGVGLVCNLSSVQAAEYIIDRKHTEIRFSWNHLGLSRQSGQFRDVIGRVFFDPDSPVGTTVDVTIKVNSLMTGVAELDRHLKSTAEYFNIARYPDIKFKSTSITVDTKTTATMTGELTINGTTKPVAMSVVWNFTGAHPLEKINPVYQGVFVSGFSARAKILRSEFGITRAIPLVSDEINISIETEMHRTAAHQTSNVKPPSPDEAPIADEQLNPSPAVKEKKATKPNKAVEVEALDPVKTEQEPAPQPPPKTDASSSKGLVSDIVDFFSTADGE